MRRVKAFIVGGIVSTSHMSIKLLFRGMILPA